MSVFQGGDKVRTENKDMGPIRQQSEPTLRRVCVRKHRRQARNDKVAEREKIGCES